MGKQSNENEIALFFKIDQASFDRLKARGEYLVITQSEVNSQTDNGTRMTNRVRRTEVIGAVPSVKFESATKYRLKMDASLTSRCVELEREISEDEFGMTLPFGERVYQKRRFIFNLGQYVAELDWYVDRATKDFGLFCKLDVNVEGEPLTKGQITRLLQALPSQGIVISELINPPWVINGSIGKRIGQLMTETWNLA